MRFPYAWPERLERLAYGGILPNLKRNAFLWGLVPPFLLAEFAAAFRLAASGRFDVIHAHWVVPQGIVAALVSRITGIPLVVTAHGGDVYGLQGRLQNALKRWSLQRVSKVTAVSDDLAGAVKRLSGDRSRPVDVISMGVDTAAFKPSRRDRSVRREFGIEGPLVLFVGRLAEKKGVRYLIDAMPALLADVPDARLLIAGDGPLRPELEAQAAGSGLAGRVIFAGARSPSDLPRFFASADVFVGPSVVAAGGDTESFGLVFAEAMASGCPVVASDVGGIRALIRDGLTGILVPERDPAAIAAAVRRLLADETLRRRLSRNALRRVRAEFDQAVIARRYSEVLQEAAAA